VEPLFSQLQQRLESTPPRSVNLPGVSLRESAVLVPLFVREGQPHVLFTKRPETLRQHPGQISFPGGGREPDDATPLHTALRETREELGIAPERVEVLGRLDELPTITEYLIVPYVGVIPSDGVYERSRDEVEEVIEVPLAHLLDMSHQRTERRRVFQQDRDVYFYDFGRHVIWGATAQIVRNLLHVAHDLPAVAALRKT